MWRRDYFLHVRKSCKAREKKGDGALVRKLYSLSLGDSFCCKCRSHEKIQIIVAREIRVSKLLAVDVETERLWEFLIFDMRAIFS